MHCHRRNVCGAPRLVIGSLECTKNFFVLDFWSQNLQRRG
jgi:hypothetical protein